MTTFGVFSDKCVPKVLYMHTFVRLYIICAHFTDSDWLDLSSGAHPHVRHRPRRDAGCHAYIPKILEGPRFPVVPRSSSPSPTKDEEVVDRRREQKAPFGPCRGQRTDEVVAHT